ncbi:MAG: hypothetical protein Q8P67_06100, partial [archaeon]|nr:hypothetical protein [archaeon]
PVPEHWSLGPLDLAGIPSNSVIVAPQAGAVPQVPWAATYPASPATIKALINTHSFIATQINCFGPRPNNATTSAEKALSGRKLNSSVPGAARARKLSSLCVPRSSSSAAHSAGRAGQPRGEAGGAKLWDDSGMAWGRARTLTRETKQAGSYGRGGPANQRA